MGIAFHTWLFANIKIYLIIRIGGTAGSDVSWARWEGTAACLPGAGHYECKTARTASSERSARAVCGYKWMLALAFAALAVFGACRCILTSMSLLLSHLRFSPFSKLRVQKVGILAPRRFSQDSMSIMLLEWLRDQMMTFWTTSIGLVWGTGDDLCIVRVEK